MGPWSRERERHGEIGSEGKKVRGPGVSNVWIGGKDGKEREQWKGEERGRGRREGREREGRTTLGFVRRFGWTVGSFSKTSSAARITKIKLSAEEEQTRDGKPRAQMKTKNPPLPLSRASTSSSSLTTFPLLTLTKITPSFIFPNAARPIIPSVSFVNGHARMMTSDWA